MVELFRELVGWWSWFQAVTHERWMRPLVRITPPSCAEPMCEAGSAHHPTLGLEGSVRSVDLRSVLFIYKYSVLGIRSEQVDGDNAMSDDAMRRGREDDALLINGIAADVLTRAARHSASATNTKHCLPEGGMATP
jgi:hypothetical protein